VSHLFIQTEVDTATGTSPFVADSRIATTRTEEWTNAKFRTGAEKSKIGG